MAEIAEHPQNPLPFLKLPAELRNIIYRYSLDIRKQGFKPRPCSSDVSFRDPYADMQLRIVFNPKALQVCQQMRQEASALLQMPQTLQISIERNPWFRYSMTASDIFIPEDTLSSALRSALCYRPFMPLQQFDIRLVSSNNEDYVTELTDTWLIDRLAETLRLFPLLDKLRLHIALRYWDKGTKPNSWMLSQRRLRRFGKLRGFRKAYVMGMIHDKTARILEQAIRRPRLSKGAKCDNQDDDLLAVSYDKPEEAGFTIDGLLWALLTPESKGLGALDASFADGNLLQ